MGSSPEPMRIALLGLGEAGSAFADDLVAAGVATVGWDPAPGRSVPGLRRADDALDAIADAELVLSLIRAQIDSLGRTAV